MTSWIPCKNEPNIYLLACLDNAVFMTGVCLVSEGWLYGVQFQIRRIALFVDALILIYGDFRFGLLFIT